MGWYDRFALVYDPMLSWLYRSHRETAADALDLEIGHSVIDVPCGTGQSIPALTQRIGPTGRYVGVDLSSGMVDRARRQTAGTSGVFLHQGDAHAISAQSLGVPDGFDRLHIFLGLSTFSEPANALARLWDLLKPGGRCVIVDVHSEALTLQGRAVQQIARADLARRSWEHLEALAGGIERTDLSTAYLHGGTLWQATATKAAVGGD